MEHPVSGHVYRFDGKRRSVWRAKYRLPDGRQVKKTLGPGVDLTRARVERWAAERRLPRLSDPRPRELHERPPDIAESGRVRSVPMAPRVAEALARLGQRELFTGDDDIVFAGIVGGYLDGSALSKRYRASLQRAGLRPLRFHDLRRHPRHRCRRHPPRPGVDGSRERPGDDAVAPLRSALVGKAFATDPPERRPAEGMFDESGQGRLV
jgi:hypothetical protein